MLLDALEQALHRRAPFDAAVVPPAQQGVHEHLCAFVKGLPLGASACETPRRVDSRRAQAARVAGRALGAAPAPYRLRRRRRHRHRPRRRLPGVSARDSARQLRHVNRREATRASGAEAKGCRWLHRTVERAEERARELRRRLVAGSRVKGRERRGRLPAHGGHPPLRSRRVGSWSRRNRDSLVLPADGAWRPVGLPTRRRNGAWCRRFSGTGLGYGRRLSLILRVLLGSLGRCGILSLLLRPQPLHCVQ